MHDGARCLSEDQLRNLLRNPRFDSENDQYVRHLDSCLRCSEALQQMAGDLPMNQSKEEIQAAFGFYQWPGSRVSDCSDAGQPSISQSSTIQFLKEIGVETDPDMGASGGQLGRLGNVELHSLLGQGGMGMVFKGWDAMLERPVAVKFIDPTLASNELARRRFIQEARLAASIEHANVVKIHSVDDRISTPALIMQFVDGQSVRQLLDKHRILEDSTVRDFARQIASGLSAAHSKKIIHRDIKPGNLLLDESTGQIKIADFGLAYPSEHRSDLTSAGVVVGTPEYMSPEQIRGDQVDERSDLFSLGAVLYEMCTGQVPFRGKSVMSIAYNVVHEPVTPIRQVKGDVSVELADLIERMLSKAVGDRVQSARQLIQLLSALGDKPARPKLMTRNAAWLGMVAVIVLMILVVSQLRQNRDAIPGSTEIQYPIRIEEQGTGFENLAAALQAADSGDTICVQSDRTYDFVGTLIGPDQITIRSNDARRAKLVLKQSDGSLNRISVTGNWTLRNIELEIHSNHSSGRDRRQSAIAISNSGRLNMQNCRILATGFINAIFLNGGELLLKDSSMFAGSGIGIASDSIGSNKAVLDNALLVCRNSMVWSFESRADLADERISLIESTLRSGTIIKLQQVSRGNARSRTTLPMTIHAERCVFSGGSLLEIRQLPRLVGKNRGIPFTTFVQKSIRWHGKDNWYDDRLHFFSSNANEMDLETNSYVDWKKTWSDNEQRPVHGELVFAGSKKSLEESDHVVTPITGQDEVTQIGFAPKSINE